MGGWGGLGRGRDCTRHMVPEASAAHRPGLALQSCPNLGQGSGPLPCPPTSPRVRATLRMPRGFQRGPDSQREPAEWDALA